MTDKEQTEQLAVFTRSQNFNYLTDGRVNIHAIYSWMDFIYKCHVCKHLFPVWIVSDEEWFATCKRAHWRSRYHICKECYEIIEPHPQYYTLDEFIANRIDTECREDTRNLLAEIWDQPRQEYIAPEPRGD